MRRVLWIARCSSARALWSRDAVFALARRLQVERGAAGPAEVLYREALRRDPRHVGCVLYTRRVPPLPDCPAALDVGIAT